jgi:hypothetical protein
MGLLCKETINVVVGNLGKERGIRASEVCGFRNDFLDGSGDLKACPLAADLDETDGRAFIEYDNQQSFAMLVVAATLPAASDEKLVVSISPMSP